MSAGNGVFFQQSESSKDGRVVNSILSPELGSLISEAKKKKKKKKKKKNRNVIIF